MSENAGASEVAAIYTDGGVIGGNPSPYGGTWAWCMTDALGRRVAWDSGRVSPEEIGLACVTNNLTELLAAVKALLAAPSGWGGVLYTDSHVTLTRVRRTRRQAKLNGIPDWLRADLAAAKAGAGAYRVELLKGHPSRAELACGKAKDGLPVSIHNVHVDRLCREAACR